PYSERKSLSTERTFQIDTTDVDWLKDSLAAMVTKLAYDLRRSGKLTSCVTVKLRYADFNTFSRQQLIPYTANDLELIRCARSLFDRLYERRQLVRLVGVKFSHLVEGSPQLDLFQDTLSDNRLLRVMDQVRDRFGNTALTRASLLDGDN
ncbi:MAG: DNA polymerase IV, partial [Saprospiraceae bacterium]|nr:DNA polymerase IV [Saprospiraceae bacterium]